MPPLRALIVDDEPIARKLLREELELLPTVEVIAEAENGAAALALLPALRPELVLLDIQMPVMDGFEFLRRLEGGPMPVVIITTAYDQHAIRAFEAGATDYLLKPISQQRLLQAVERAARLHRSPLQMAEQADRLQEVASCASPAPRQPIMRRVVGRWGEEYFLLNLDEILAFQAERDLTWIVTAHRRYYAVHNLSEMERRINDNSFRRIHRNALVNVNQIRKLSIITSQRWLLTLNNGDELVVSKRQAGNIRDVLHW